MPRMCLGGALFVLCGMSACHRGARHDSTVKDVPPSGVIVLAGGGGESALGDKDGWSARLYGQLLDRGDVSGDGRVQVALLAARPQTEWLCRYYEWLGAHRAFNVTLDSMATADDPGLDATLAHVDAIFIKGGEQGRYYDMWNGRRIESIIRRIHAAGGGIGGTSAGAMALAQFAITGGKSFTSEQVRLDSHSPWLDDAQGGTAIHTDFLGLVPDCLIDTHFSQRGRFVRLVSAFARSHDEARRAQPPTDGPFVAIGLDERTGLYIQTIPPSRPRTSSRRGPTCLGTVVGQGIVTQLSIPSEVQSRGATAVPYDRTAGKPLTIREWRYAQYRDGDRFVINP